MKAVIKQEKSLISRYGYLLVFLLPFLFFSFSLSNGFVYFDDDILVIDNQPVIGNPANLGKLFLADAFLNNSSPYYRPMQNVTLMMDAQAGGASPAFYHFMNLVYHCLCCVSLLWLLQVLGFSREKAFAGTVVFSVHPLMANLVFWIPARGDLLVCLFGLLFLASSIRFARTGKLSLLLTGILCFTVALFSKESAVILPLVLLAYLILKREKLLRSLAVFIPLAVVAAIWFYLRSLSVKMIGEEQMGISSLARNLPFPFEIIARFIFPFSLDVTALFTTAMTGLGIILTAVLFSVFLVRRGKTAPLFLLGTFWYIAFSLPNMYVWLRSTPQSYEYLVHRAYMPIAGLLISILALLPEKMADLSDRRVRLILISLVLMLGALSVFQGRRYHDAQTFWNAAIRNHPDRAWFYHFLGRYYFKQKDYMTFEAYTLKAISLKDEPFFLYNLGLVCFLEKKQYDTAFYYFNRARSYGFNDPEANKHYVDLCIESAKSLFDKGEYKEAAERCRIGVDLDPLKPAGMYNLGIYLAYSGEIKKAAACWRRSILLDPGLKEAYRSLYFYYFNNTVLKDSAAYYSREYQKRGGVIEQPSR